MPPFLDIDVMTEPLSIQQEDPRSAAAVTLVSQMKADEETRYHDLGPDTFDSFQPEDSLAPRSAFLIARLEGLPVGCGALRPSDLESGEINRMYVIPEARRRGIARAILNELERLAAKFGYRRLLLETGNRQSEAIALYAQSGFRPVPPFGSHMGDTVSLFFGKEVKSR